MLILKHENLVLRGRKKGENKRNKKGGQHFIDRLLESAQNSFGRLAKIFFGTLVQVGNASAKDPLTMRTDMGASAWWAEHPK
jgi:hypothetical protein